MCSATYEDGVEWNEKNPWHASPFLTASAEMHSGLKTTAFLCQAEKTPKVNCTLIVAIDRKQFLHTVNFLS